MRTVDLTPRPRSRQLAAIVDCYTVESSGLGVPPYLSTYARAAFSALRSAYKERSSWIAVTSANWYGPLDHSRSHLTLTKAIELNAHIAQRSGILVHITGDPDIIAARLLSRDEPSPSLDRVHAILNAYRAIFAHLQGSAQILTVDTTDPRAEHA
jgi:hypothetical protein